LAGLLLGTPASGIAFHEPDICFDQSFQQQVMDKENRNPKNRLKIKKLTPNYTKGEENPYLTKEAESECSYIAVFIQGDGTQVISVSLQKGGRFIVHYYE
jgi:hypothetical protein